MSTDVISSWKQLPADFRELLPGIKTKEQHKRALDMIDSLLFSEDPPDESSNDLIDLLWSLIEEYETANDHFILDVDLKPIDIIKELMAIHNLKQKDLVDFFGTQSIVSEVLSGKRKINLNHATKLSNHFQIDRSVFLE